MWKPKPDPPVRRDKKCVVCGKQRADTSISHGDPFCSSGCARKWHGVDLTPPMMPGIPKGVKKK